MHWNPACRCVQCYSIVCLHACLWYKLHQDLYRRSIAVGSIPTICYHLCGHCKLQDGTGITVIVMNWLQKCMSIASNLRGYISSRIELFACMYCTKIRLQPNCENVLVLAIDKPKWSACVKPIEQPIRIGDNHVKSNRFTILYRVIIFFC